MPEALLRARILWAAMMGSHFMMFGVAFYLTRTVFGDGGALGEDGALPSIVGPMMVMAAVSAVAISALVRQTLLARSKSAADPAQAAVQTVIVGMAITESAIILGLVHALLTGEMLYAGILFGIGFGATILHWPIQV